MSRTRPAQVIRSVSLVAGAVLMAAVAGPAAAAAEPPSAPAPAADGRIALVQRHQIVTISPDGTDKAVLTDTGRNYGPTWSPDGRTIAYVHQTAGQADLWIMNADGAGKVAITTLGQVSTAGASWSPDGRRLVFGGPCLATTSAPSGRCEGFGDGDFAMDTVRSTAPYGDPVTVLGDQPGYPNQALRVLDRVAWSPNGDDLAYASDTYGSYPGDEYLLVLHRSTGAVDLEAYVGMGGVYGTLANPSFDPDGGQLGYDAYIEGQPEIIHRGIEVCGYPSGTCDEFREVLHDSDIAFAPAQGRVALVRDLDRDRVVIADADGRHRTPLARGTQPSWQPPPAA